jgi:hypothetical protein
MQFLLSIHISCSVEMHAKLMAPKTDFYILDQCLSPLAYLGRMARYRVELLALNLSQAHEKRCLEGSDYAFPLCT